MTPRRGPALSPDQRIVLGSNLRCRYEAGETVRALADELDRSYGWVHGLLAQAGTRFRGRGGGSHASKLTRGGA